jgi:hypothetical protein
VTGCGTSKRDILELAGVLIGVDPAELEQRRDAVVERVNRGPDWYDVRAAIQSLAELYEAW